MAQNNQAQEAYNKIRKKLISRTLDPGFRLIESVWAEKLEVNRADIRQALSRLLGEGLLRSGEKGGFFVREYTAQDMQQFNEVRFALEAEAVRLATERATEDDLAELQQVSEHMQLMAENGYAMGVFEVDMRFHEVLIKAAHNEKLEQIYASANLPLSKNIPGLEVSKDKLMLDAYEHRQIVETLRRKDPNRAIEILSRSLKIK